MGRKLNEGVAQRAAFDIGTAQRDGYRGVFNSTESLSIGRRRIINWINDHVDAGSGRVEQTVVDFKAEAVRAIVIGLGRVAQIGRCAAKSSEAGCRDDPRNRAVIRFCPGKW
jgi:hypothetical protein